MRGLKESPKNTALFAAVADVSRKNEGKFVKSGMLLSVSNNIL